MIKQIKTKQERVRTILENNPNTRDNDFKLISKYWEIELNNKNLIESNFLIDFSKGLYSSPEAITRARRKEQELNPKLRGQSYKDRQDKQLEVRFNINN